MTTPESSQPERVNLRDIWPHEGYNFTPWLADNLDLLGKEVDMRLKLSQTEAPGWAGFLDILAERVDGVKVAIENQLEASDSDHFARLLGYAAEHDAHVLIWVASQFWEYHLRQVAWLNKAMSGNAVIYAVAVRLLPGGDLRRAGSDETAPGFHAEFSRVDLDEDAPEWAVLKAGDLSETAQMHQDFFLQLLGGLRSAGFTDTERVRTSNDQEFPSGFPGIDYHVGFWGGSNLDVYLWIATWDRDRNKQIFDALYQQREEIEKKLPGVGWGRRDNQRMSAIYLQNPGSIRDSDEKLVELRAWASDMLPKLKSTIQPRLEKIMSKLQDAPEATQ